MNSRQLLEIANRAIATGGIAPPSEVLDMAQMAAFMCRIYNQIHPGGVDLNFTRAPVYKTNPVSGDTISVNTRDYAD